jgi:hypothetical protein
LLEPRYRELAAQGIANQIALRAARLFRELAQI